ncbi:MAG: proton-conducting transporter membrane subunit [Spirochaetes bacterium]|nr:proton-conducting transporter membrane subunit [Spirochaetota bacterium]
MAWILVILPLLFGSLSLILRNHRIVWVLLLFGGILHSVITLWVWIRPIEGNSLVFLDPLGMLILTVTSALFLMVVFYSIGYLKNHKERSSLTVGCLFLFLAAMSLVSVSADMGLLWVAVEATTLASAPLIYFHKNHQSLEAAWKYLLICSVGIALALMGNIFLSYAGGDSIEGLYIPDLLQNANRLDPRWLKVAFILFLVGYGTKMGLAPLHSWLPDAHSEAPSMVSALLSGSLLNCAFLGILRAFGILRLSGLEEWGGNILILFGVSSLIMAALFLIQQTDFKRMLAYSSVEHMGILALGIGVGGLAGTGALLHLINHSLAKSFMFLVAGNILVFYQTKNIDSVTGLIQKTPKTAFLWMAGFLAIAGSPPFGLFMSEWIILKGLIDSEQWVLIIVYLLALFIVFASIAKYIISMTFSDSSPTVEESKGSFRRNEPLWMWVPPFLLASVTLILGLYVPQALLSFLSAIFPGMGGI